jgi:hypothetical protein
VRTQLVDDMLADLLTRCEIIARTHWGPTHVKISHPVSSLPTSRQQVVFALLVASCQQVRNKLLTICNNLVDIIRLAARLFDIDIVMILQYCYNIVSSTL